MKSIVESYQNIPSHIDPTAFTVGSFSVGWYSIMYIIAFVVVYFLLSYRLKKGEGDYNRNFIADFIVVAICGVLIGGRLGYVIFYDPSYYLQNPLAIISPYDFSTGELAGIYGMSYHGGLLAVIFFSWLFLKKNKINFWKFADFVIPAIPAGYFFGRIGNFLNLELYGRMTDSWIGMHFPLLSGTGPYLRYPSQLFEALFEGLILFIFLWSIRNKKKFDGYFLALYLVGYGIFRFGIEFIREPDEQLGYFLHYLTLGQILSFAMIVCGILIYNRKRM